MAQIMIKFSTLLAAIPRRQMSQGFKVYTKTGDKGTTSLYTGARLEKSHQIFTSLGSVDELNAHLGLAREHYTSLLALKTTEVELADHDSQLTEI
jgi:cob(I)alamin adenosyltransferase